MVSDMDTGASFFMQWTRGVCTGFKRSLSDAFPDAGEQRSYAEDVCQDTEGCSNAAAKNGVLSEG